MNRLSDLMLWYSNNCNDDWEHSYGVKIDTIDNPGWSLQVDLNGTVLERAPFSDIEIERTEHDWIHCSKNNNQFIAVGGAKNLEEMLSIFLDWAAGS
ncbi:immunity 53 family protein [Psychrosphaera algicola]|uniref:Immunity 53 family protein n=1 Tax=Psychrosphaera algicola TaxID=3023714 RepID=A0ABT5FE41_9GAMM|nr:immunity 53 family protein [Psychrosphaera sp. G1-22]MDC2889329.1 immunity 53 family protein [Psychrosphaera sp. G1-22]